MPPIKGSLEPAEAGKAIFVLPELGLEEERYGALHQAGHEWAGSGS